MRNRAQLLVLLVVVFISAVILVRSITEIATVGAFQAISFVVTDRNYLPAVFGSGEGGTPAPTATLPASTATSEATATAEETATPTSTPEEGRLAAPTLFDILNNDGDGTFKVGWSSSPDAEYYILQQEHDSSGWQQIYEGSSQEIARDDLDVGQYCYRVMALNPVTDSEWSNTKCTNVSAPTSTPDPQQLETPVIVDIDNADNDGNFLVNWDAIPRARNYRLQQKIGSGSWVQVYEGADTGYIRARMNDGTYCYRVQATNSNHISDWSAEVCVIVNKAIITPDPGDLDPPSMYQIPNDDLDGEFTVRWTEVPEAEWYTVHHNYNGIGWGLAYQGFDTGLYRDQLADGEYCYRVRSFTSQTHSIFSNVECATVDSTAPTATPSPTLTPTATATIPTVTPEATPTNVPFEDPITNGDFESGPVNWFQFSTQGYSVIYANPYRARSGYWYSWLGGAYNNLSWIEQAFLLPEQATKLTFYAKISSSEYSCYYDYFYVNIVQTGITDQLLFVGLCRTTATYNSWRRYEIDISDYAGEVVALKFAAYTDYSYNSNVFLDDISISDEPNLSPNSIQDFDYSASGTMGSLGGNKRKQ